MTGSVMMAPKVSVVIPTCNRAELLRAAIDSVLGQTFRDFEIIVVDDASTDETPAMMRALSDPRVRYLRHDSKRGQGATRNAGIREARGEYIALLDDDDEWLPEKLKKQVDLLDASPAAVGLIYTGFLKVSTGSARVLAQVKPEYRGEVYGLLARGNWIGTCSTVLLRRACFDQAGYFDEDLASGADYDMWVRVARYFQVDFIEEPLVRYRIHGQRISTSRATTMRGVESLLRKHGAYFSLDAKNHSRRYANLGIDCCLNGDARRGRNALQKAIRLYPYEPRHYYYWSLSHLGSGLFRLLMRRNMAASLMEERG